MKHGIYIQSQEFMLTKKIPKNILHTLEDVASGEYEQVILKILFKT
jgi:hypothetical protein